MRTTVAVAHPTAVRGDRLPTDDREFRMAMVGAPVPLIPFVSDEADPACVVRLTPL